jgi:hypothetical protein
MFPAKELAIKEASLSLKIAVVRICQREEKAE